jgi:hypothetical protein
LVGFTKKHPYGTGRIISLTKDFSSVSLYSVSLYGVSTVSLFEILVKHISKVHNESKQRRMVCGMAAAKVERWCLQCLRHESKKLVEYSFCKFPIELIYISPC